jgi:hypothetical protein
MFYRNSLHAAVDRLQASPLDLIYLYELLTLVALGGQTEEGVQAVRALPRPGTMDPLLLLVLEVAVQPVREHVEGLTKQLNQSTAATAIRAAAWWNLGVLCQALRRWKQAREAFEACHKLRWYPFVAAHLARLDEDAGQECSIDPVHLSDSLSQWGQLHPREGWPETLDVLVPRWWGRVPTCADRPVLYRVNRHGNRYLIGCRRHHRLIDSTLGPIGRVGPRELPQPVGLDRAVDVRDLISHLLPPRRVP